MNRSDYFWIVEVEKSRIKTAIAYLCCGGHGLENRDTTFYEFPTEDLACLFCRLIRCPLTRAVNLDNLLPF